MPQAGGNLRYLTGLLVHECAVSERPLGYSSSWSGE